jgi:predicted dehydrogenase
MKVLIIGSGDMARIHFNTLPSIENIEFSGFVDLDIHRATEFADKYHSTAFTNMKEAFDQTKPDCAFLITPRFVREDAIQLCIDRKIPVFIEKPPCESLSTGKRILEKLQASGLIHSVGFRHRYNPPLNHFLTLSKGQNLSAISILLRGPMFMAELWKTKPYPFQQEISGGIVGEGGIHFLDLARYICQCEGNDFEVLGSNKVIPQSKTVTTFDVAGWVLKMENGTIVTTLVSWGGRTWRCIADLVTSGGHATVELLPNRHDLTAIGEISGKPLNYMANEFELKCEQQAFFDAVKQNNMDPIRSTYADSLKSFELAARLNNKLYGKTAELL